MRSILSLLLAAGSAIFTFLVLLLPWKVHPWLAFRVRTLIYWLSAHLPFFQNLYMNVMEKQSEGDPEPVNHAKEKAIEAIPGGEKIAIAYSGGSDSTLAAIFMAEKFQEIHLVTCTYSAHFVVEESRFRGNKLIEKFGRDRVFHHILDIEDIFQDVYYCHYFKDIMEWGLFKANICGACKIAMELALVRYCLENDIHVLASGANKEFGKFFIGQMRSTEPIFNEFLGKYGIQSYSPVYDINRSDKVLCEMKFMEEWEFAKFGLYLDGAAVQESLKHRGQVGCHQDIFTSIYCHGYYIPVKGYDSWRRRSIELTRVLLDEFALKWVAPVCKAKAHSAE